MSLDVAWCPLGRKLPHVENTCCRHLRSEVTVPAVPREQVYSDDSAPGRTKTGAAVHKCWEHVRKVLAGTRMVLSPGAASIHDFVYWYSTLPSARTPWGRQSHYHTVNKEMHQGIKFRARGQSRSDWKYFSLLFKEFCRLSMIQILPVENAALRKCPPGQALIWIFTQMELTSIIFL